mgnify:CR=1 FL=1
MNIDDVPFNRLIGLQREPAGGAFGVSLPAGAQYHNHLGIVHAAAQLAVARSVADQREDLAAITREAFGSS